MNESSTQLNTPLSRFFLAVLSEVLSYFRWIVITPMILVYGFAAIILLFTFWSIISPTLSLPWFVVKFFPQGFTIGADMIEKIIFRGWAIISIALHLAHRAIEAITHKKFEVGFFKKLGLLLLSLTIIYVVIIGSSFAHLGWFTKEAVDVPAGFIFFYLGTVTVTIICWLILGLFDMIIYGIQRAEQQQEIKNN